MFTIVHPLIRYHSSSSSFRIYLHLLLLHIHSHAGFSGPLAIRVSEDMHHLKSCLEMVQDPSVV